MHTSMSSMSAKKRKVDELESEAGPGEAADASCVSAEVSGVSESVGSATSRSESGDAACCPDLPATAWGNAMNYLPYTDVISCLAVNRVLSFEAPKYVEVLSIYRSSELELTPLHRTHLKRFQNVTSVVFLDLITDVRHWTLDEPSHRLNVDAIERIVPFLERFPKLGYAFVGGRDLNKERPDCYDMYGCTEPANHNALYRVIIERFAAAFERGSLPKHLQLDGVIGSNATPATQYFCDPGVGDEDHPCTLCRRILSTFPLNTVISLKRGIDDDCMQDKDFYNILRSREWAADCLEAAATVFTARDGVELMHFPLGENAESKQFQRALLAKNAVDTKNIYFLSNEQLERIEFMVELGCDIGTWGEKPGDATKEHIFEEMEPDHPSGGYALAKSTFDRLRKVGYPFDENDFVVVDDLKEPAIRHMYLHTRSFVQSLPDEAESEANEAETDE